MCQVSLDQLYKYILKFCFVKTVFKGMLDIKDDV